MNRSIPKKTAIALLSILVPIRAYACETEATARPDSECVVMQRGGIRGVWFRLDVADELRRMKLEFPELRIQTEKQSEVLALRESQVIYLRQALDAHEKALAEVKSANEILSRDAARARQERDEAKAELGAWYRSPILWTAIGSGATLGGGFLLKFSL